MTRNPIFVTKTHFLSLFKHFQVFDGSGSFLSYINTSADPLYGPQGLALTSDGHVVVADSGNHCFKVYRYLQWWRFGWRNEAEAGETDRGSSCWIGKIWCTMLNSRNYCMKLCCCITKKGGWIKKRRKQRWIIRPQWKSDLALTSDNFHKERSSKKELITENGWTKIGLWFTSS